MTKQEALDNLLQIEKIVKEIDERFAERTSKTFDYTLYTLENDLDILIRRLKREIETETQKELKKEE